MLKVKLDSGLESSPAVIGLGVYSILRGLGLTTLRSALP